MELSALSLAELDPEKFMKDAKHLHCFKNLELNREKAAEVRNWEPEEPCRRNTHQRNITAFCCCCGPREEMRAARQGLCPAGQTPAPPSQEGFVSSYEVLAYFLEQVGSTSFVIEFSFHTVVHFCLSTMGLKCIHAVRVLPNTGQARACVLRCKENCHQ